MMTPWKPRTIWNSDHAAIDRAITMITDIHISGGADSGMLKAIPPIAYCHVSEG